MLTKYARASITDILEVKSSPERVKTASLDRLSDFHDYRTEDDYLYVRVRAISSRVNKNNDGWPSEELKKAYTSFHHKPIFVDHNNHDPSRARGVIVDTRLHVDDERTSSLDSYYSTAPDNHKPPTWIELLLETDARSFPRLANAVAKGDIDGVSMGCNVEWSKCSVCDNEAHTPDEYCEHIKHKGTTYNVVDPKTGHRTAKQVKAYEDCYGVGFFEISYVFDPADETALIQGINDNIALSSIKEAVYKEAGETRLLNKTAEILEPESEENPDTGLSHRDAIPRELYERAKDIYLQAAGHNPGNLDTGNQDDDGMRAVRSFLEHQIDPVTETLYTPDIVDGVTDALQHDLGSRWGELNNEAIVGGDAEWLPTHIPERQNVSDALMQKIYEKQFDQGRRRNQGSVKESLQPPPPQSDMPKAPSHIDTLRQETLCPVCGSTMEDGKCGVCNFEEPPDGFDNPDLQKAQEVQQQQDQNGGEAVIAPPTAPAAPAPTDQNAALPQSQPGMTGMSNTNNQRITEKVTSDTNYRWHVVAAAGDGGRINTQERPILPVTRQLTDKPINPKVVSDSMKPVESNIKENTKNMSNRTADSNGAAPITEAKPAARVDVTGVGGVAADDHPDVTQQVDQVGGEVLNEDAQHENVDKVQVTDNSGPTKTWHGIKGDGDSAGQQSPVSRDAFSFVEKNALEILNEDHGKQVNLEAPLKEELGGPTSTWGSDEFHITDPVTNEGFPDNTMEKARHTGPDKEPFPTGESFPATTHHAPQARGSNVSERDHIFNALRVAKAEVQLGIVTADNELNRAAELEEESHEQLTVRLDTLSRVHKAKVLQPAPVPVGGGNTKTAGRVPSLRQATGGFVGLDDKPDLSGHFF